MDERPVDIKPALHYEQVEILEKEGKKYTGNHQERWVDNKSICTSCQNAHIMRRGSQNRRSIYCNGLAKFVPEDINECNEYRKFTELSLSQMANIATLVGGLPERKVGFYKE